MVLKYDKWHRPTSTILIRENQADITIAKTLYGEQRENAKQDNFLGQVWKNYAQDGKSESLIFDFKGNGIKSSFQYTQDYKNETDWSILDDEPINIWGDLDNDLLENDTEIFYSKTELDALNRPTRTWSPHNDNRPANIIKNTYNQAGQLKTVSADLNNKKDNKQTFVKNILYNEKGQRTQIIYGNDTSTKYTYDEKTYRLSRLKTFKYIRDINGDIIKTEIIQDLNYTFDAVGNISQIKDDFHEDIFFKNKKIEPIFKYTYDALYQLIEATGREHAKHPDSAAYNPEQRFPVQVIPTQDALVQYIQSYKYDKVGNIEEMVHKGDKEWTREYTYDTTINNALLSTKFKNDLTPTIYEYDAHGCIKHMSHLRLMEWDFNDQLKYIEKGDNIKAWYQYDASGERSRKIVENNTDNTIKERRYLGGFEIYVEIKNNNITLERETLHISDGENRIAMIDTKTIGGDEQYIRYQYGNHLGSASLELDENAEIISYEEYHPYGTTAYQLRKTDVPEKRYRYTGMERDEESGLNYHSARYLATWLGRWICPDPAGTVDGGNLWRYGRGNPVRFIDPLGTEPEPGDIDFMGPVMEPDMKSTDYAKGFKRFEKYYEAVKGKLSVSEIRNIWVEIHKEPPARVVEVVNASKTKEFIGDSEVFEKIGKKRQKKGSIIVKHGSEDYEEGEAYKFNYYFIVDKPTGMMYKINKENEVIEGRWLVGLGKRVGDLKTSGKIPRKSGKTQSGWAIIWREVPTKRNNHDYGWAYFDFKVWNGKKWKDSPTGIHGTEHKIRRTKIDEAQGRVSGGCTRLCDEDESELVFFAFAKKTKIDKQKSALQNGVLFYFISDETIPKKRIRRR